MSEEEASAKKAIAAGLLILDGEYEGESDFDEGMRALQKLIRKGEE